MSKTPPILLPYQTAFNNESASVAVWEKSRRIGASYGLSNEALLYASSDSGNVYYMSYDKDMTAGFITDCSEWAEKLNIVTELTSEKFIDDDDKDVLIHTIKTSSGKIIQTLSSVARALRSKGRPGDLFILDEAAFCDDLDGILKAAMAFTIWGGMVRILSTHNGDNNPFNLLINDIRAGKVDYALHRTSFDDAIEQGLWDKLCQVKAKLLVEREKISRAVAYKQINTPANFKAWYEGVIHKYRHNKDEELFCIPSAGTGAYLPRSMIEPQMIDVPTVKFHADTAFNKMPVNLRALDMQDWLDTNIKPLLDGLDDKNRHYLGEDFARKGDMTILAPMQVTATLERRVVFLIELHNMPYAQQRQALFYVLDALPKFSGAGLDATGNGAQIGEETVDEYGSKIVAHHFTEALYREHMPKYKSAFEDKNLFIPKSDDVLEDHRAITLVNGVPKLPKQKTNDTKTRHGDSAIAIWLGYLATLEDLVEIDYMTHPSEELDEVIINDDGFGAVPNELDTRGY